MTDKQAKILYCALAVPMICLIAWGTFWFAENQAKRSFKSDIRAIEKRIEAEEKAKLPVEIYRGTYDGKEIIIRMYEPIR